jgi:hypothetical protein
MRARLKKLLPAAVGLLAVALALYVVVRDRHQLSDAVDRLGVGDTLLAFALATAGTYALVFLWRSVLAGLGAPTELGPASRVFFVSQLGKYLPGSIWPVVAQMEFGRRRGIARRTMLAANVITLALNTTVALVIASVLLPLSSTAALHRFWWTFLLLPPLLACLHPRVIPAALNLVLRVLRREQITEQLDRRSVAIAVFWASVSWLLLGLHLYAITAALGGSGGKGFLAAVGGVSFAVAVGVLFIPAPAGAGVRDTVLVLTLAPTIGDTSALAAALASRVLLVMTDVVLAGVFGIGRRAPVEPDAPPVT